MQKDKALIAARLSNLARVVADGSLTVLFKERRRPAVLGQHELHQHCGAAHTARNFQCVSPTTLHAPMPTSRNTGFGQLQPAPGPCPDSPAQNPCQGQKPLTPSFATKDRCR